MMRSLRRDRHGLAEIVGTLMLVVIVVAAATAFSFFVAAYQKQLQAQETLSHDRALENIKVIGVSESVCALVTCTAGAPSDSFATVSFLVSSLDVNAIYVTGLFFNEKGVVNYSATYSTNQTVVTPCYDKSAHIMGNITSGLVPCTALTLPSYSAVTISLNLDEAGMGAFAFGGTFDSVLPSSDLSLEVLTQLTNVFTETFAPPNAVASIFFVSSGDTSVPVLDGLDSYQPPSANNASILSYAWTLTALPNVSATASDSTSSWTGTAGYTGNGSCADVSVSGVAVLQTTGSAVGTFGTATLGTGTCSGNTYSLPFTVLFTATEGGTLLVSAKLTYADGSPEMSWTGNANGTVTASPAPTLSPTKETISGLASIPAPAGIGYSGDFQVTALQYPNARFAGVSGTATYTGGTGGTFSVVWSATSYAGTDDVPVPLVYGAWEYDAACAGGTSSGPELECSGLVSGVDYSITLTVMNTDGLIGMAVLSYVQP